MKYSRFAVLAVASAALAGCGGGGSVGGLDAEQAYSITLTQAQGVPTPKATTASGSAEIVVYPESVEFQVFGSSITGITMAHIHSGAPGVAGPVVVSLFLPSSATGAVNSMFASGIFTASNLPAGVTLAALKALLLGGNSYVDVHTSANPTGEIRGQVK